MKAPQENPDRVPEAQVLVRVVVVQAAVVKTSMIVIVRRKTRRAGEEKGSFSGTRKMGER